MRERVSRRSNETLDQTREERALPGGIPGVVVVVEAGQPTLRAVPLAGGKLVVGREGCPLALDDHRVSREHADIAFAGVWSVTDKGSRNGTLFESGLVRVGQSLLLLENDIRRFADPRGVETADVIVGPTLRQAYAEIDLAAKDGATLLVTGESGTGKELAAQRYHRASTHASGPKVDVNCAAIPKGVAESMLFGAVRGAFTGAVATTKGSFLEADGGVLFLDEIGELDLEVQAKLLRVLETKEVTAVGQAGTNRVEVLVCAATNRDLRTHAAGGQFRADLFYRLAQHEVHLPPLRERREEIPWLVAASLRAIDPRLEAHAKLLEVCLLRPWPGNVREMITEVRRAGRHALARNEQRVTAEDLDARAGLPLAPQEASDDDELATAPIDESDPERQRIVAALAESGGNVAATARALGWHRNQLYRAMKRHRIPGK